MAIKGTFVREFNFHRLELGKLGPGTCVTMVSHPEEGDEMLFLRVYDDDSGAEVYSLDNFEPAWIDDRPPDSALREENLEACIWPDDKPYKRRYITQKFAGLLVLEYVDVSPVPTQ
jgi:hypothetical protein